MALIHRDSKFTVNSELQIFNVIPTDASTAETNVVLYGPQNNPDSSGVWVFNIIGNTVEYLKLGPTFLEFDARILKANRQVLGANDKVAPVNNFGNALIATSVVEMEGVVISSNSVNYPYRSHESVLFNYGSDAKSSFLERAIYAKDTAGKMEDLTGDENDGFKKRMTLFAEKGRYVYFYFERH